MEGAHQLGACQSVACEVDTAAECTPLAARCVGGRVEFRAIEPPTEGHRAAVCTVYCATWP